jgi:hypothetical protein
VAYLLVPALLAGLVWLAVADYRRDGTDSYQPTIANMTAVGDTRVTITFSLHTGDRPVTCRIQAQDDALAEVGYTEVTVPARHRAAVTAAVPTSRRAYGVRVLGCRAG